jgi:hypothetical protein
MRKLALLAAVVCLICCYGMNAAGQTTVQSWGSHFVGAAGPWQGAAGTLTGMNDQCQSVYGPDAHMCTVDQFYSSASISSIGASGTSTLWLQPSFHDCVYDSTVKAVTCRQTGVIGRQKEATMFQTCNNWLSNKASDTGTVYTYTATFIGTSYSEPCNKLVAIACCAP